MSAFARTGRLVLLALRRDRIKLTIWIVAILGLMALGGATIKEVYGTPQQQMVYASTTSSSVIGKMFGGPVDGPNLGSVTMVEYFLFTAVLVAFMSTLSVMRHTRQNEETGRSELIGSAVVGRYSMLSAALLVTVGANVIIAAGIAGILIGYDYPTNGSLLMAAGIGGVGVVFSVIAAVISQVIGTARGANSLAGAVIGLAFLIRAIGDGIGKLAEDGLSSSSHWLSWLSPISWGQQAHPFTEGNWWPIGLYVATFLVLLGTSFYLAAHRDFGLGMIPARRGPARAVKRLLSPLGLAWRLQRGVLIGWFIGMVVLGITFGVTAVEFQDLLKSNEQFAQIFSQSEGANTKITDLFFTVMTAFVGIMMAGYALQGLMRLRSEEAAGQLEALLATSVSKPRWMMSHISWVLVGIVMLALAAGAGTGIAYVFVSGESWSEVTRLILAVFLQVPAALILAGAAILLFGLLPRLVVAVAWSLFAACLLIVQLGEILKLPDWAMKLSPFTHTPGLSESAEAQPLITMLLIVLVFIAVGLVAFRRRDLTTS